VDAFVQVHPKAGQRVHVPWCENDYQIDVAAPAGRTEWKRMLEELRRRLPDAVIDGRQQYQWFGPWTWLAGSYSHPTTNDEQPGSFENFPDLHLSRVSANRQRFATYYHHAE
jgi:hypothetical protein